MKRDEIKKIIPEITKEQLNAIMRLNGEDIGRTKSQENTSQKDAERAQYLRQSCSILLNLLERPADLRGVLLHINRLYRIQCEKATEKPQETEK